MALKIRTVSTAAFTSWALSRLAPFIKAIACTAVVPFRAFQLLPIIYKSLICGILPTSIGELEYGELSSSLFSIS